MSHYEISVSHETLSMSFVIICPAANSREEVGSFFDDLTKHRFPEKDGFAFVIFWIDKKHRVPVLRGQLG